MSQRVAARAETLAWTPRLALRDKLGLVREVLSTYVRVRRAVRRTDLPSTLAALRAQAPGRPEPDPYQALVSGARLSRAVTATLPRLPVDSSCLLQSLVLSAMLARRDIPGRLVIGVQPGEDFGAHAWVEVHERALLDPGGEQFARLVDL